MSKLDPDQRKKIVTDALTQAYGQKKQSATDILYARAQASTDKVRAFIKPLLMAGAWKEPEGLRVLICKMYLQEFDGYSKEDLVLLVTGMHLEIMMQQIKDSPWGSDKPDLLSGK